MTVPKNAPKTECLARARKLADWFVANQVTRRHLADCGRYADHFRIGKAPEKPIFSTNWTTGMTVIAMLMAWKRTGDRRYRESAERAGSYLKSLQVLDARSPRSFGSIREVTPQTNEFHPRDALSAAWGLLHLGLYAGDQDALWRAKTFAEWFGKNSMRRGYPAWTFYIEPAREPYWEIGSFHGGSPLFFFDLYAATREKKWLRLGLTICDTWIRTFPKPDGSIRIEVDPKTGRDLTGKSKDPNHIGWQDMHKTNDDFTAQALLRAYRLTKKPKYLAAARRFLDWALTIQRRDGAFGRPAVNSAAATLILEMLDMAAISGERKYREAALKSVGHFFSLQELKAKAPRFHGGYYCIHGDYVHESRLEFGVRTACYALAALLRLEGKRKYAGYTA
jgi:uncharacterized protein YyaL (SSP411 family)